MHVYLYDVSHKNISGSTKIQIEALETNAHQWRRWGWGGGRGVLRGPPLLLA